MAEQAFALAKRNDDWFDVSISRFHGRNLN